jgi:hypothetical protein
MFYAISITSLKPPGGMRNSQPIAAGKSELDAPAAVL